MILLKQFFNSINSRGAINTIKWVVNGFLKANNFIVFYRDLSTPVSEKILINKFIVNEMSDVDLKLMRSKYKKLPVEFYCDESHGFQCCYVVFIDSDPVAIQWLVRHTEKSRFLNLKDGDVELNYNVVLPQFRGRRIAEYLMAFIINDASIKKYKRIFGVVHASNIPQFKPMLRLGFEPVECLTHFLARRPKATLRYVK